MNQINKNKVDSPAILSLKLKLLVIFIDYIIIIAIISILNNTPVLTLEQEHPWLFRLFIYFLYYVFPEYFYKKTLGMKFFGVFIFNKKTNSFKTRFLKYSLLVFFDRFLFLVIYTFGVLLSTDKNLLISEKFSGLIWKKKQL